MPITDITVLPPAVKEYYDRLIIMTAFPKLVHGRFAQVRTLPENSGDTIVFRRYSELATVPIPIIDGITPPGAALSITDLKATVSFYGNFVTFTNQVQLTVEDKVINESSKLLAENMGRTIDEITRDVLASTTSVVQASGGINGGTPTELSKRDMDAVTKLLLSNNAEMISEVIVGSNAFATGPVRPAFMGIIHSDLLDDLENVSNFQSTANYSSQDRVMDGEWGSTGNVRWVYTSIGSVSGATPAVYNNFIIGKEAYGVVHLGSDRGKFKVKPLGSAGAADPLDQRGSVSWTHPFTARILNDSFMANLMATHS